MSEALDLRFSCTIRFGYEYIYPQNERAKIFCKLLKRNTASRKLFPDMRALGFDIYIDNELNTEQTNEAKGMVK